MEATRSDVEKTILFLEVHGVQSDYPVSPALKRTVAFLRKIQKTMQPESKRQAKLRHDEMMASRKRWDRSERDATRRLMKSKRPT